MKKLILFAAIAIFFAAVLQKLKKVMMQQE